MEAPPGIDPNETRQPLIIGVTSFVLSVAFLAVVIRTYTRALILRQFGMDDWAAIVTFLLVFASGFSAALNTTNGFGKHVYFLTREQITSYMRNFYVSVVFYNAALAGIKATFLFQYYRVLAIQKMKKIFIAAIVLIGGWSISQILVEIFICTPIASFWDKSIDGTCIPNYPGWYINAAGNIVTDIIIFVLPLPVIGKLKLARGQKYVLLVIFSLGFFTCAISFIRIRYLELAEDVTWENVESAGWSVGELSCGLTCACLPTLRPFVSRFIPGLSSRGTKSSNYQHRYGAFSSGKTPSASKHRDVELGVKPTHSNFGTSANHYSRRRTESSDSKADLYGMASYDLNHADSSQEVGLPIQGTRYNDSVEKIGHTESGPSPTMFRQQSQDSMEISRYRSDGPVVETHIEAGQRCPSDAQLGGPIKVQCDIVQVASPRVDPRGFS